MADFVNPEVFNLILQDSQDFMDANSFTAKDVEGVPSSYLAVLLISPERQLKHLYASLEVIFDAAAEEEPGDSWELFNNWNTLPIEDKAATRSQFPGYGCVYDIIYGFPEVDMEKLLFGVDQYDAYLDGHSEESSKVFFASDEIVSSGIKKINSHPFSEKVPDFTAQFTVENSLAVEFRDMANMIFGAKFVPKTTADLTRNYNLRAPLSKAQATKERLKEITDYWFAEHTRYRCVIECAMKLSV